MPESITPSVIRTNNKKLIYQYIYDNHTVSQQDLSYQLHLSRPTITNKLAELEASGMVCKGAPLSSDLVGRKAASYEINASYRIAIGVEIQHHVLKILGVDLYGKCSRRVLYPIPFENTDAYADTVCKYINDYICSMEFRDEQILGIGIAVPGLVSPEGDLITYCKILNCTGLRIDHFRNHLRFPCRFFHDAGSAAQTELWASPDLCDFIYLNVSVHLGTAMISDHRILDGLHGHCGTAEHIRIRPKGRICYCGSRGCMETLCSLNSLLENTTTEELLDDFFRRLRSGEPGAQARWNEYLRDFADAINLMHLMYDTHYVFGGYLAPYLLEEDLDRIYDAIEKMTPFEENRNYLQISKMPKHSITIGAALPYIREFLDSEAFA